MLKEMPGKKGSYLNPSESFDCVCVDVHVMFATLASPEEFRPFVQDFDRDIIRMNAYPNYADAAPVIASRLATGKEIHKLFARFNSKLLIIQLALAWPTRTAWIQAKQRMLLKLSTCSMVISTVTQFSTSV